MARDAARAVVRCARRCRAPGAAAPCPRPSPGAGAMIAYFALVCFAILTLAVHDRWAWSLFQVGMFALAGWRGVRPTRLAIPLAAAAVWPILQVALGTTVSRGVTLD